MPHKTNVVLRCYQDASARTNCSKMCGRRNRRARLAQALLGESAVSASSGCVLAMREILFMLPKRRESLRIFPLRNERAGALEAPQFIVELRRRSGGRGRCRDDGRCNRGRRRTSAIFRGVVLQYNDNTKQ